MKIAFYLGSFNPFHKGHLKVINEAIHSYGIQEVVIVPSMQNPWKNNEPLEMEKREKIILESLPNETLIYCSVDTIEKQFTPPYYSYKTLEALKEKYCNDELYILCGKDTMNKIASWKKGMEIIKEWKFIVIDRPLGDISSSMIRELIKDKEDISPYVEKKALPLILNYYKDYEKYRITS